jgi:hypothetical protein
VRLYRGVYAVGHRKLTNEGWWLAAVRAIGPGAALSHVHAAALFDLLPARGGRVDVTVVSRGRRQRKGIRVHSVRELPRDEVTTHRRITVTTPARTLTDRAGTVDKPALARALEAAEARRLLDVPSLLAVSAGRPGAVTIRELVAHELPHTRSEFEAAFNDLCDRYGLPRPLMNTQVGGFEVDAYWPDLNLVVELDSWRHHGTRAAFERGQGARRRAPRPGDRDAPLHLPPGHDPPALGGEPTRATFSIWIFFIAPFRRVSGSGASEPRATSADRYARSSPRMASAREESSTAPCPGTTKPARSTSGSSRSSVAR